MAKTFLWIEDRKGKASYIFWENFMKQLLSLIHIFLPYDVKMTKQINIEEY